MKTQFSRRGALLRLGGAIAGLLIISAARKAKAVVQKVFVSVDTPKDYDPTKHKWLMCIDDNKCIGCGLCVEACKRENGVPEGPYFRTWIERYIIPKPKPGSDQTRGEALVDSPHGGMHGSPNRRCRRIRLSTRSSSRSCATCARIRLASKRVRSARRFARRMARC